MDACELIRLPDRRSTSEECCAHYPDRVSGLSVDLDRHHRAQTRRERVLAVQRLWRGLERLAARDCVGGRLSMTVTELARELEELIAALDRRVPRVAQAGEADIAPHAAALRAKAVDRLAELVRDAVLPPPTSARDAT
jgi:hypothetical protein